MFTTFLSVAIEADSGEVNAGTNEMQLADGYTALHWAVENNDLEMVCLLLDHDADPNQTGIYFLTAAACLEAVLLIRDDATGLL